METLRPTRILRFSDWAFPPAPVPREVLSATAELIEGDDDD